MRPVRIDPTPDGPRLSLSAIVAMKVGAAVARDLDARPDVGRDRDLEDVVQYGRRTAVFAADGRLFVEPQPDRRFPPGKPAKGRLVEWWSSGRVAASLGTSRQTVANWCRDGLVPGVQRLDGDGPWIIPADALPALRRRMHEC